MGFATALIDLSIFARRSAQGHAPRPHATNKALAASRSPAAIPFVVGALRGPAPGRGVGPAATPHAEEASHPFKDHPLFAGDWYWSNNQRDTEHASMAPHEHYQLIGAALGFWPHPLFDPAHYAQGCSRAGLALVGNPITHYNDQGATCRVTPHRLFDPDYYATELSRVGRSPDDSSLTDYLVHGDPAGLSPHALFSVETYRSHRVATGRPCLADYALGAWRDIVDPCPLFDAAWYLERHGAAREAFDKGIDPITHYILEGHARGYATHPAIDAAWYNALFVTGSGWERTTTEHIRTRGPRPTTRVSLDSIYSADDDVVRVHKRAYADGASPLVSIIIINMDGAHHLEALFASLHAQTYANYEIVLVDNNSSDASVNLARRLCPGLVVVELDRNAGFAEANNIGLQASRGELIALLNNDTRVDANWLSELVASLARNPGAGAVTSRVRFWSKFRSVTIHSAAPFTVDHSFLSRSLTYAKVIVDRGTLANGQIASTDDPLQGNHVVEVKLPADEVAVEVHVRGDAACRVHTPRRERIDVDEHGFGALTFDLSSIGNRNSFFVINNAGSHEPSWLATTDTGFGEIDIGQYGVERTVPLACGCAMIVRRAALCGEALFPSDFIAYFEDSELSRRLRRNGNTIVYSPAAIVYHRHSSTSTERSAFWHKQVRRNGILYRYMETSPVERADFLREQMMDLNHYHGWLGDQGENRSKEEDAIHSVLPRVMSELTSLCAKVDAGTMVDRAVQTRIGVYNRYWSTLGGGEAHALFVASYLARHDLVELISDIDFDLDALGQYFGVDVSRFRKRLIPTVITPATTGEYDVFVNSTYMDETPSLAANSYYIVSFPSRSPSPAFLGSYKFLTNSHYTRRWAERYWGEVPDFAMLEPVVADALIAAPGVKKRVILSVGRFFQLGHSKNQLQIVKAFKAVSPPGWTLKLVGSVGCQAYLDAIEAEAEGCAVEIHPNAPLELLVQLYREASIYLHASGLGRDQEGEPENFEHFGMTVAEACANGCFPIVFAGAGPAGIVEQIGCGRTFDDEAGLAAAIAETVTLLPDQRGAAKVRHASQRYVPATRLKALQDIFASVDFPRGQSAPPSIGGHRMDDMEMGSPHVFAYWNGADQSRIEPFKDEWREAFPNFRIYEDDATEALVMDLFPEFIETYRDIRIPAARSDVARLVILYLNGGLYIDCHCGIKGSANVLDVVRLPPGKTVALIDRALAEGPKAEGEHIFQSSVILARKGSPLIYALARQAFANLSMVRDYEHRFGRMTYHIGALSGPGLFTNMLKVPFSPDHEIKEEFRADLHIIPEEACPIVRNKFGSYRPPNTHWYHRQQHEPLFESGK